VYHSSYPMSQFLSTQKPEIDLFTGFALSPDLIKMSPNLSSTGLLRSCNRVLIWNHGSRLSWPPTTLRRTEVRDISSFGMLHCVFTGAMRDTTIVGLSSAGISTASCMNAPEATPQLPSLKTVLTHRGSYWTWFENAVLKKSK
jgi:hypothetical protein